MPRRGSRASILAVLLLAGAPLAQAASPKEAALSALLPPKGKAPACAKLFVPPDDFEDPCGGAVKRNPQSSADPAFASCMADMLISLSKAEGVKAQEAGAAASVTFEAGGEMSVIAVSFVDDLAAGAVQAGLEKANAASAGAARNRVFRSGTDVALATCDAQFDTACCAQMLDLVSATWKKP